MSDKAKVERIQRLLSESKQNMVQAIAVAKELSNDDKMLSVIRILAAVLEFKDFVDDIREVALGEIKGTPGLKI